MLIGINLFCYFIQKKGFLDGNSNYLQDKLAWCQAERGEDRFYSSFYKGFLVGLFQDGLNSPRRKAEFEKVYGRIPYLNGGMFDRHQIENEYPDIDIPDRAFERLFIFFDKWRWHLDTRISASGKDINPDVLGFIFEKYINNRAEMGAYYTKEDITEYIGRNCILTFLFDKAFGKTLPDEALALLRNSGTTYIYPAQKKGYTDKWREAIPQNIAQGLIRMDEDTSKPITESHLNLAERRKDWNTPADEEFALQTEIWRETVERLTRTEDVHRKIESGEIREASDFVTYNLDIRQFAYDLIAQTKDSRLVSDFYHSLLSVTILDPTCGSGAFLFAAMNILEPLYEVCIERMADFNRADSAMFATEMGEIKNRYRSNIHYFVYKSIILRNLYGVDIMQEATEIAKLRLFLKMVAVVDVDRRQPNLGIDPLPDIDFNIRCGNTLVGFASESEINDLESHANGVLTDMELYAKAKEELRQVSETYNDFRAQQLSLSSDSLAAVKESKAKLKQLMSSLNDTLNDFLCPADRKDKKDEWIASAQPFHWIAEYYQIMHDNGGFDVIIGNPPYVEYKDGSLKYSLEHLKSANCGNLYGNCIERGLQLTNSLSSFGFIIPVAITCSKRMDVVIKMMKNQSEKMFFSNFDDRPGKLFEMIEHLRASIFILRKTQNNNIKRPTIFSTKYNRWYTQCRESLFSTLCYSDVSDFCPSYIIPKVSLKTETRLLKRLFNTSNTKVSAFYGISNNNVYFRAAGGGYFVLFKDTESITYIDGVQEKVKAEKVISFRSDCSATSVFAILSTTLFYWFYISQTDCRNVTKKFIDDFPIPPLLIKDLELNEMGKKLSLDLENNRNKKDTNYKTGHNVIYYEYYPKKSKPILDEIDRELAKHYGLTEEELDFVTNYDVKYRMGEALGEE